MAVRNEEEITRFGKRVREIRKEKGYSMEKLAELCDLEYSQIARIEGGKINTTLSTIHRLAAGLGVGICELFK